MRKFIALTLAFALCTPVMTRATDGRIPIAALPYVVNAPGHYYLTKNLTTAAASHAIRIFADDVDLDLAGFTAESTNTGYDVIFVSNQTRVRIHGGQINGGSEGILLTTGGTNDTVITVEDVTVTGFTTAGIDTGVTAGAGRLTPVFRRNFVGTASTACYLAISFFYSSGGLAEDNTVTGCRQSAAAAGYGIFVSNAAGARIRDNVLRNTDRGIVLSNSSNNVIDGNTITGTAATRTGIAIFSGSNQNIYSGNRLTGNAVAGITDGGTSNVSGGGNCFNSSFLCF